MTDCNHENCAYLKALPDREIFCCVDCGCLIDIDPRASRYGERAMTVDEIDDAIRDAILVYKNKLQDIAEIIKDD